MDYFKILVKIVKVMFNEMEKVDSFSSKQRQKLYVSKTEWRNKVFGDTLISIATNFLELHVIFCLLYVILSDYLDTLINLSIHIAGLGLIAGVGLVSTQVNVKWKLRLAQDKFNLQEKVLCTACVSVNIVAALFSAVFGTCLLVRLTILVALLNIVFIAIGNYKKYVKIGSKIFEYNFYAPKCYAYEVGDVAARGGISVVILNKKIRSCEKT